MKIIGIVGALDFSPREDRLWRHLRSAFEKEFPDATFRVEHALYWPWQAQRMHALGERILARYDTGEDILLFGYSLGGIIARRIAPKFKQSRIIHIATVATPHALFPTPQSAPTISFGGIFDPIIFFPLTKLKGAAHAALWSDHLLWFIVRERPAQVVAHRIAQVMHH